MDNFVRKWRTNDQVKDDQLKVKTFYEELERMRLKDPLIGAKIGAYDLYNELINCIKQPEGYLICNVLLVFAGGFAGYACQAAVWEKYVQGLKRPAESVFNIVTSDNGRKYYFGNILNQYLMENQYAVVSLAEERFHELYEHLPLPSINPVIERTMQSIGDVEYKICGEVSPGVIVKQIDILWDRFIPKICRYCKSPDEWPILFGGVVQKVLELSKGTVDPVESMNIVLESAFCISKMESAVGKAQIRRKRSI